MPCKPALMVGLAAFLPHILVPTYPKPEPHFCLGSFDLSYSVLSLSAFAKSVHKASWSHVHPQLPFGLQSPLEAASPTHDVQPQDGPCLDCVCDCVG